MLSWRVSEREGRLYIKLIIREDRRGLRRGLRTEFVGFSIVFFLYDEWCS